MRVEGYGVLIYGDVRVVEQLFELLARNALVRQIQKYQVIVRAARNHLYAAFLKTVRHRAGVSDYSLLVSFELGRERFLERHGFCGDDVHERSALHAGEHGFIYRLAPLFAAHNYSAAGTAQRLVRSRGDKVGIRHGRRVQPRRNKSRDVRDIRHHERADLIADLAYSLKVDDSRIGGRAADYELGLALQSDFFGFVVVKQLRLPVHAVGHYVEVLARDVDGRAVREMSAVGEIHAHDRVARLARCKEHGEIGARARVGLHVAVFAAEQLFEPLPRKVFGDIHKLAAAVVAVRGVAFGIFIGEMGARRGEYRGGDEVLARNELYVVLLAVELETQRVGYLGVGLFNERDIDHSSSLK